MEKIKNNKIKLFALLLAFALTVGLAAFVPKWMRVDAEAETRYCMRVVYHTSMPSVSAAFTVTCNIDKNRIINRFTEFNNKELRVVLNDNTAYVFPFHAFFASVRETGVYSVDAALLSYIPDYEITSEQFLAIQETGVKSIEIWLLSATFVYQSEYLLMLVFPTSQYFTVSVESDYIFSERSVTLGTSKHCLFDSWYWDVNLTVPYENTDNAFDGMILYPRWILKKYAVSYMNSDTALFSVTVDALSLLVPFEFPQEIAVVSWYYDKTLLKPYNPAAPVTGNMSLYAKWLVNMVNVEVYIGGELYGEYSFPYDTSLSAVKAYIESLTGAEYHFFKDAGLTQPVTITKLTGDITVYAEADDGDAASTSPSWFEKNKAFVIGAGCVLGVIVVIAIVKKIF